MQKTIGTVLEAAEIRQEQWERVGYGVPVHEVVEELHEVAGTLAGTWGDDRENEAQSIAEEQGAAIAAVREQLPPNGLNTPLDTLASNALCIWETVLDIQREWKAHRIMDEPVHDWLADGEGAFSARDGCWNLAGWAEFAWDYAESSGGTEDFPAFDWDFIPCFIVELHRVCRSRGVAVGDVNGDHVKAAVDSVRKSV